MLQGLFVFFVGGDGLQNFECTVAELVHFDSCVGHTTMDSDEFDDIRDFCFSLTSLRINFLIFFTSLDDAFEKAWMMGRVSFSP